MSYEVKQGNIFGRIGSGLGKGLSEQIPKEVERGRLASGLKQFEQESANLTPIQQLSRLSSIPGITPQMIQSFGELGKQQAKASAISNVNQNKSSPFPKEDKNKKSPSEVPSLTKEDVLAKAQEGYIPPTQEEKLSIAGEKYNENPALFENNPQKAIEWVENKVLQDEKIANAYQKQHQNLTTIQDNVVNRLKDHSGRLGVEIPANVYSKIEDKAIQATKPRDRGGRGLTEQQAMKEYGKELDEVSRDYKAIDTVGNWGITGRKASETLRNLKSLENKFYERGDTENFADTMISQNKFSPIFAYSIAEKVSRIPELSKKLSKTPDLTSRLVNTSVDPSYETLLLAPNLAESLGQNGSPLAVAYELQKKGYDPGTWLEYVDKNRKNLKLSGAQERQLDKPNSIVGTLNDWWLSSWSGIEENK